MHGETAQTTTRGRRVTRKRPEPKQGKRGTEKTRRMQRYLAQHIFDMTKSLTQGEAAALTGLSCNDIKNLRVGNMPSLRMLIDLVRTLRIEPESMLSRGATELLRPRTRTTGAQSRFVRSRIRAICKSGDAKELAKKTGLPITSIYQMRTQNAQVGIHSYLAFVSAGFSASELLLGANAKPN